MKSFIKIFALAAVLLTAAEAYAIPPQVKARLDSVKVLMGRMTALHLEVVENEGAKGLFPALSHPRDGIIGLCGDSIELRSSYTRDTTALGSGRVQINYDIPVQAFDSGTYVLPPFIYVSGRDTVRSNGLILQVVPVPVTEDAQISDYAPVMEPEDSSIFDYLPQWIVDFWWLILTILLLIGLTVWGYMRYRDRGYILPRKPEPSPYVVAMSELRQLKAGKLWERGLEKEYFTKLTDILRNYLDRRFSINAMEMTSDQIVRTLSENAAIKEKRGYIRNILTMADFVKFAKVRPLPTDSVSALEDAERFVEETKPSEEEEKARQDAEKAHEEAMRKIKIQKAKKMNRKGKGGRK